MAPNSQTRWMRWVSWGALAAVACGAFALVAADPGRPGLYYDECTQAAEAAAWLRGERPLELMGARQVRVGDHWIPWTTQPYHGALKTFALVPGIGLFGADAATLRRTTLAWAFAGLALFVAWTRQVAGPGAALAGGVLLALDPSFLFGARHDYGPFALGFACRMGGLLLVTGGWRARSTPRLAAGGLLLGLSLFHKLDGVVFVAGCTLAAVAAAPADVWRELRERWRGVAAALAGGALGAAPMAPLLPSLLAATRGLAGQRVGEGPRDLGALLALWRSVLDGSYVHRLLQAGGRFDELGTVAGAPGDLLVWLVPASLGVLAAALARDRGRGRPAPRVESFALLATVAVGLGALAMPGAVLMHHVLNAYPLPHLVAALALVRLGGRGRAWRAALAAGVVLLVGASALRVDLRTLELVRRTGGTGYWSDALGRLARELPAGTTVVSVDWGFHAQLRYAHPGLEAREVTWRLASAPRARHVLEGGPGHVYLAHDRELAVLPFGTRLLRAARRLPADRVSIRAVADGRGRTAFHAIRFPGPHRIVYRRGAFRVETDGASGTGPP